MKRPSNPVLPSNFHSGKQQQAEPKLSFEPCMVCNKHIVQGYYGRYSEGGVCSKSCDIKQSQKAGVL